MLKIAVKTASYLAILLPTLWLLWTWQRDGAITLVVHLPLAAAEFLMLQNALVMPLASIYSQCYDAEPRHFSTVPLVGEVMIYLFAMALAQAQKWQPHHELAGGIGLDFAAVGGGILADCAVAVVSFGKMIGYAPEAA